MNPLRWPLHWQVLSALVLAAGCGLTINLGAWQGTSIGVGLVSTCEFVGTLFMNALRMVVVPLVATSIITGMLQMGGERDFARLGIKTLAYYTASGFVAIVIGLILVNLIQPGNVTPEVAAQILGQAQSSEAFADKIEGRDGSDIVGILLRMVPTNIFETASDNSQLLGLITFVLLYGFFVGRLRPELRDPQAAFWNGANQIIMGITELVIRFAPIGVFGLVAPILARTGFSLFQPLMWFFITVLLGLLLHTFGALALALRTLGGISPWKHYRAMAPVMLTAFSTASSASTLPVTMETVEKSAGVSQRVGSFTLPLGATVNMDGTALYECVVVMFIAQIYGVIQGFEVTFAMQVHIVLLSLLTSVGVAGIPAASLVAITVILGAVGLPIEAIGIVWVTDRILDMCRTSVNVFSDTVGAVIIARSEGETVYPATAPALPTS
jgi:Na+/H+-dicarboxylate symporter